MISIQENISLKSYNTLHIDVKARFFVKIQTTQELSELMQTDIWDQNEFFILGGGANVLFTKDWDGIVIKNEIVGKDIIDDNEDIVLLKVGAGESRPMLVNRCVDQGYGGIENMAFIPGNVGASAVGNIGAYGVEAKDVIEEVEYINVERGTGNVKGAPIKTLKNAECKFGYRDSIFKNELKGKYFITAVTFRLKKVDQNYPLKLEYKDIQQTISDQGLDPKTLSIKDIPRLLVTIRSAKMNDPRQTGTAGSFFKNPIISQKEYEKLKSTYPNLVSSPAGENVKLAAGQLVELSGLKGYKKGNVGISNRHALVLINLGDGTGSEMLALANHIISEVKKNFGVTLEPEVIII